MHKKQSVNKYIPSLITLTGLFFGFAAIAKADFTISALLILLSFICDGLDGFVARLLNAQSEFGKQLDSLSDIVCFGVAPAYLYYLSAPDDSILCMIAPAFIVLAGAARLARFNVLPSKTYFRGLPIPANAFFFAGIVLAIQNGNDLFINAFDNKIIFIITPIVVSFLMVTDKIRMFGTKTIDKNSTNFIFPLLVVVLFIVFWFYFSWAAFSLTIVSYIVLSIFYTIKSIRAEATFNDLR